MDMTRFLALTVISVVSHVFTQVPGGESTMDNSHVRGTFKCTGPRNSPPKTADADMTHITTLAQHDTTKSTERPDFTTKERVKTADADMTPITTLAQHDTTKSTERPESTTEESVKYQSMYRISDYRLTWSEAVDRCHQLYDNGHLVHIDNVEENIAVRAILDKPNIGFHAIWIGIHDSENEGEWTYEDGSNHTYVNWGNGEPNSAFGLEEDCAVMSKGGDYIDVNCEWEFHFCCEYYVVV